MNLVGHEYIGVDGAFMLSSIFFQPMEIGVVVFVSEETRLAIVPRCMRCSGTPASLMRGRLGIGTSSLKQPEKRYHENRGLSRMALT